MELERKWRFPAASLSRTVRVCFRWSRQGPGKIENDQKNGQDKAQIGDQVEHGIQQTGDQVDQKIQTDIPVASSDSSLVRLQSEPQVRDLPMHPLQTQDSDMMPLENEVTEQQRVERKTK